MGKLLTKAEAQEVVNGIYGEGVYTINRLFRTSTKVLKVEVECCRCSSTKEYTYKYVRVNNVECVCSNMKGLRTLAENYVNKELYIEPDEGYLVGQELEDYIVASLAYDKPGLKKNADFIQMVEEYMLEIYEKKNATRCTRCRRYYPKRRLTKGVCKCCRKGI